MNFSLLKKYFGSLCSRNLLRKLCFKFYNFFTIYNQSIFKTKTGLLIVCACVHVRACLYINQRSMSGVFLCCFPPYFLESLNLYLAASATLTCQHAPGMPLSSPALHWDYRPTLPCLAFMQVLGMEFRALGL